ncbi:MAG: SRPBCC family protein [Gemmatimonadales bacterium]
MQRDFSISVDISVPPERVWPVLSDVERWHEWTDSITSAEKLTPGPLAVGMKVKVRQPKLPSALWTVSELQPGQSFTWISTAPGILVTAKHSVVRAGKGSQASLSIHYGGLLGAGLARLTGGINDRYIAMEAAGLKHRSENPDTARARI